MKLLVAEDDRAVRTSLERALALEGYDVVTVKNGAEALARLADEDADALLLDVTMPTIDGLTVCRMLRSEGNRVPILMLTARATTGDRIAGLDAGADDYLPKPFDLGELLARIRALLRRAGHDDAGAERPPELHLGDLRVDVAARRVWRGATSST